MDLWSNGYQLVWEVNTAADVQIPASDIERNVDFGRVNFTPIAFYSLVGLHPDQQICAILRSTSIIVSITLVKYFCFFSNCVKQNCGIFRIKIFVLPMKLRIYQHGKISYRTGRILFTQRVSALERFRCKIKLLIVH